MVNKGFVRQQMDQKAAELKELKARGIFMKMTDEEYLLNKHILQSANELINGKDTY